MEKQETQGKQRIFKLIRNKRKTLKELPSKIINEYVDGFTQICKSDKNHKIIYGVNVRLSRESSDNVVYPFSASFPDMDNFDSVGEATSIPDGYKIPDFLNRFSLKEAVFRVDYSCINSNIEVKKVSRINILTERLEKGWYTLNPFYKNVDDSDYEEKFKEFFTESGNSFVHVNIKGLELENEEKVYVWVCGEDPDVSVRSDGSYLTNILAIANDADVVLKTFIEKKRFDILEFVMLLKSRKTDDADIKQKKEAIKSAKAAIMSRNMSHNLGSHVMSYLKQKLGSITSILNEENKVLYNLYDGKNFEKPLREIVSSNVQLPFLVGTGRFIGYLQERQDYIATIATDYIPYGAPVNMKDAIYDELNPDLRYMRHNDTDNNRPLNILLSYIAKSEGLTRENMGKAYKEALEKMEKKKAENPNDNTLDEQEIAFLKYRTENDILFGYKKYEINERNCVSTSEFGLNETDNDSTNHALSEMRGYNFSLPGGLVGRQALFSIIENLIRNAAKHGNTRAVDNLKFTFDIIDLYDFDNCIDVESRIYDENYRKLYRQATDRRNLNLLTITDNLKYEDEIVNKLHEGLYEPYIDDATGNMNTGNKGIKEIRISAAWLRSETNEDAYLKYGKYGKGQKSGLAPLVGVEFTKEKNLRYMICVQQDRFAAVITKGMQQETIEIFKELQKSAPKDWKLYNTIDSAKKDYRISYRYMLVEKEDVYNELRPYTSNRLTLWKPDYDELIKKEWEKLNSQKKQLEEKLKQDGTIPKDASDKEAGSIVDAHLYKLKKDSILQCIYHITEESEPIYIWDGSAYDAHKDERNAHNIPNKIKLNSSETDVNIAKYVYRTHHSTDSNFSDYWSKKANGSAYSNILCIDAITGDNSSDRIVRREPLDNEWYYSHLYAMKKKIAIFDERIFKIVHNIDENKFLKDSDLNAENKLDILIKEVNSSNDNINVLYKIIEDKGIFDPMSLNEIKQLNETKEEIIETLRGLQISFSSQEHNNFKSIVYKEKGVDVFTIIEETDGVFAIVGCVEYKNVDGQPICKYDKIGTISAYFSDNDELEVSIEMKYEGYNKYDYISIHQGILDKIYEGFNIKQPTEINNKGKLKVTQKLFEKFMENSTAIDDYLPCFIVHSGRAKPTIEDMPQKLPFIQYAAIEHAAQDCKYALVELLDYARYEPSNDDENNDN